MGLSCMKAGERESGNEDSKDNMNMMEQPGWLPGVTSSECIRKMSTRRRDHQIVHQNLLGPMVREGDLKGRVDDYLGNSVSSRSEESSHCHHRDRRPEVV